MHLTEQKFNNRSFIRGTLADVLSKKIDNRIAGKPTMFSPFGLGVLDLALSYVVKREAEKNNYYISSHVDKKYYETCKDYSMWRYKHFLPVKQEDKLTYNLQVGYTPLYRSEVLVKILESERYT